MTLCREHAQGEIEWHQATKSTSSQATQALSRSVSRMTCTDVSRNTGGNWLLASASGTEPRAWSTSKGLALIRSANPQFRDLSEDWWGSSAGAHGPADDLEDSSALRASE